MFLLLQSLATLGIIFFLLWKKNSHNAIFWGFSFQWLAINIKVIQAFYLGVSLDELVQFPNYIFEANRYANISIIIMALVISMITRNVMYLPVNRLNWSKYKSYDKIYIYYSIFLLLGTPFSYNVALQQIFVYLALFKFGLLFIALNHSLSAKQKFGSLIYVFVIFEIILSFTGYFAAFKNYFYVLLFTFVYQRSENIKLKDLIKLSPLIIGLVYIGVLWSAVKKDFRSYVSEGETVQANTIGTVASLQKMAELTGDFSVEDIEYGSEVLIDRISYIDYYSATMQNVPLFEPHTNGSRLKDALLYGLQPRILFPNKAVTDDSEATAKYTGIFISGKESATSISLGYMTDGYIDFGSKYFWITPAVIAMLLGFSFKYLFRKAKDPVWALAITFPFFQIASTFESDSLKVIPPIIYYTLIALLFLKFVVPFLEGLSLKIGNKKS